MRDPRIVPTADVALGGFVCSGLLDQRPGEQACVGHLVPAVFEAYARIFHPVPEDNVWLDGTAAPSGGGLRTWAAECRRSDASWHAAMQWDDIAVDTVGRPAPGRMPEPHLERLVALLPPGPTVYALWEGWCHQYGGPAVMMLTSGGGRPVPGALSAQTLGLPCFELPDRRYLLFTGPLMSVTDWAVRDDTLASDQHASLFWAVDHSWCVVTEIDLDSTLVGASRAVIDAILADDVLEAAEVDPFTDVSAFGDTINHRA